MKITSPLYVLLDQIRDLFDAELQVSRTLPQLAANSPDPALRMFLEKMEETTLLQLERLEWVSAALRASPSGDKCKAMNGLIEGGNRHIRNAQGYLVTNLILVAHVNRIIYYQIAAYDFADALSKRLDSEEADFLLEASLCEEREAALGLAELATRICSEVGRRG
jgi:ferritin-like metal-binding protein YciE